MEFISKGNWFDEGTKVRLIDDYKNGSGLFEGIRTCKNPKSEDSHKIKGNKYLDQEICSFEEFIIKGV